MRKNCKGYVSCICCEVQMGSCHCLGKPCIGKGLEYCDTCKKLEKNKMMVKHLHTERRAPLLEKRKQIKEHMKEGKRIAQSNVCQEVLPSQVVPSLVARKQSAVEETVGLKRGRKPICSPRRRVVMPARSGNLESIETPAPPPPPPATTKYSTVNGIEVGPTSSKNRQPVEVQTSTLFTPESVFSRIEPRLFVVGGLQINCSVVPLPLAITKPPVFPLISTTPVETLVNAIYYF